MFNFFKKKPKKQPQKQPNLGIRDTLFGDKPFSGWPKESDTAREKPWISFARSRETLQAGDQTAAIQILQSILTMPNLESRHYLQAWHFLREMGVQPDEDVAKKLYGVVVEVAMGNGHDILAAYADYTARYFNYTRAAVIWEAPDTSLNGKIDALFRVSETVVQQIGPWEGARPSAPPKGQLRLNFLTPNGLHFGQGAALASDPMGEPVLSAATHLMQSLIEKTR